MRILIDTDAFCKLAIGGVLEDSLELFGADLSKCGRLPALPYMLRRGNLRLRYGPERCDELIPIVGDMPIVESSNDSYLDRLIAIPGIDPGEAQLFAKAIDAELRLITGDKRSLRALQYVAEMNDALSGRIIVFESILLELCENLGLEEVRQRIQGLDQLDNVVKVCFSEHNSDSATCLLSYFHDLAEEVRPLVLWHPNLDHSV